MGLWRSLFGGSGWNSFPRDFSQRLRDRIGDARFDRFTKLCERRKLFPQMARAVRAVHFDPDLGMASFLTSAGNDFGRQGMMRHDTSFWDDSIEVFSIALELKPDHFPARMGRATTHRVMGNVQAAQSDARHVIATIDEALKTGGHSDGPAEFPIPDSELRQLRQSLLEMLKGDA